jgi:hypothetical protein
MNMQQLIGLIGPDLIWPLVITILAACSEVGVTELVRRRIVSDGPGDQQSRMKRFLACGFAPSGGYAFLFVGLATIGGLALIVPLPGWLAAIFISAIIILVISGSGVAYSIQRQEHEGYTRCLNHVLIHGKFPTESRARQMLMPQRVLRCVVWLLAILSLYITLLFVFALSVTTR